VKNAYTGMRKDKIKIHSNVKVEGNDS